MAEQSNEAIQVLRAIWAADGQNSDDLDIRPQKVCKKMQDVSFDGFAAPGADLHEAWRDLLRSEGKRNDAPEATIRDLVMGQGE